MASRKTEVEFGELKFGETTLKTVQKILKHIPLSADSTVFDLGCGRGRAAFLLHFLSGCKVVAVDLVGPFIQTSRRLSRWLGCETEVQFLYENFLTTDLAEADMIYCCALCLGPDTRQSLAERLQECRDGTHLVTVGWDPRREWLQPVDSFESSFSWGTAQVYIKRIDHAILP